MSRCSIRTTFCESFDRRYWKDHYLNHSIRLLFLDEQVKHQNTMFGRWFLERSLMVKSYLANKNFDCIYFQDWQAAGFHSIQAKRVGLAFPQTQLAVVVNSPHEWVHENDNRWAERGDLYFPYLKWCERYCCQHADFLHAPSQYILDWLEGRGWKLAPRRFITPFIRTDVPPQDGVDAARSAAAAADELRLAFFSRLETRTGLEVFLDALEVLADNSRVKKVCFLGPAGQIASAGSSTESEPPRDFIQRRMRHIGIPFEIIDSLHGNETIAFIKREKLLAVMPALAETFGLAVYDCILNHIPFLCSDIPTFREMVHPACLFGNTAKELVAKLDGVQTGDLASLQHPIDLAKVNESWISRLNATEEAAAEKMPRPAPADYPLVSICVPYYNYGKYLPGLIRSLENSSYKNFEVILVNDGSTDPLSNQVFEDCRQRLGTQPNWRFISKNNGGIGQTRNLAAQMAAGDYLIFMDADNEAKPHMIETFVRCAGQRGALPNLLPRLRQSQRRRSQRSHAAGMGLRADRQRPRDLAVREHLRRCEFHHQAGRVSQGGGLQRGPYDLIRGLRLFDPLELERGHAGRHSRGPALVSGDNARVQPEHKHRAEPSSRVAGL